MKTRYKIFLIIGSFCAFYFGLIPALQYCNEFVSDCTFVQEMALLTRPAIIVDAWSNQGIQEWSGTAQGIEKATLSDYFRINQKFILSMIIFPGGLIGAVIIWDKRK